MAPKKKIFFNKKKKITSTTMEEAIWNRNILVSKFRAKKLIFGARKKKPIPRCVLFGLENTFFCLKTGKVYLKNNLFD